MLLSMTTAAERYEVLRQRHVEAFTARLAGEADKLTWPLEQLHALRDMRLRALLRAAKEGSPWHAERLRSIDPDAARPPDLASVPTMTKADLMAHWDDIVTDRRPTPQLANDN